MTQTINLMNLVVSFTLILLAFSSNVRGQDSLNFNGQKFLLRDLKTKTKANYPLFIIHADNKVLQIPNDNLAKTRRIARKMKLMQADWIESLQVITGKDAIEKYGTPGRNGVIVFVLKDGTYHKLPRKLKRCRLK